MTTGRPTTQCSWCLATIVDGDPSLPLSHGCCPACVAQLAFDEEPVVPRTVGVYALFIENPATGYLSIQTYPTSFARALQIITLSAQPLILSTKDY